MKIDFKQPFIAYVAFIFIICAVFVLLDVFIVLSRFINNVIFYVCGMAVIIMLIWILCEEKEIE